MVDEVSGGAFDLGGFDCFSDIGLGLAKDIADKLGQNFDVGSWHLALAVSKWKWQLGVVGSLLNRLPQVPLSSSVANSK